MDKYSKFKKSIEEAADRFRQTDSKKTVRIVSHLDADGLSSAAIMISAMNKNNMLYSLSTVYQLDEDIIKNLAKEPSETIFFTDLGSGQLKLIKKHLSRKTVFILDHHQLQNYEPLENVIHINPHLFQIDGAKEISGSGVTYLFAKAVNKNNLDTAHIALMGAAGDVQEDRGFKKLNQEILKDAEKAGTVKVIMGLRLFGANTKPLHKLLERSGDHPIPGVTGSESSAVAFIRSLGINMRGPKGQPIKLIDLTDKELQKLSTAIIMRRLDSKKPEDILGPVYILKKEKKGSPLRDLKEFATVLNACGRLEKSSAGIGACLGNEKIKKTALKVMAQYRREIYNALKWFRETPQKTLKGEGYLIINAESKIKPTIIGTLASIVSHFEEFKKGTLILSLARMKGSKTKISLRYSGNPEGLNLKEIAYEMVVPVGGQAGGHFRAAGALIDTEKEPEFLENAKKILESQMIGKKLAV